MVPTLSRAPSRPSFPFPRSVLVLAVVVFGAPSCDRLRPGFCEKPDHCPEGEWCDLEGRVAFRQCVPGTDAGAGGDAGDRSGPTSGGNARPPEVPIRCGANRPCPAGRPLCLGGQCVECDQDIHCADPTRRFCAGNVCVDCRLAAATACGNLGRVCDPSDGSCVECLETADCKTAGQSFCAGKVCVGCQAEPTVCKAPTGVCDPSSGACVECLTSSDCTLPGALFCNGNRCVGCAMAGPETCAMRMPSRPACAPDGTCVECRTSADCAADPAKPICMAQVCAACASDAECALKLGPDPGVCLRHLGGRCATDAETIYVRRGPPCGAAGTSAVPLCAVEAALPLLSGTRRVVLLRGVLDGFEWNDAIPGDVVSVIGQNGAVLAGGAKSGVGLAGGGTVYLRGITVRSSELAGISATDGVTLRLENVVVDGNRGGGILLDGARFEIRDVRVTDNGAGQVGAVIWSGILVQNVPSGGPARLERVSIVGNQATGLSCDAQIEGTGVHVRANAGTIDVSASCRVTSCPTENATCGSSSMAM
jgi:hypothetical protein